MMKLTLAALTFTAFIILLQNIDLTDGADCNTVTETYKVSVARVCNRRSRGFLWSRRSRYYVCGTNYVIRRRTKLVCRDCGGCDSSVTTERPCNLQQTKKVTYTASSVCYYRVRRFIWRRNKSKLCYSTKYRSSSIPEKHCCDGMALVDSSTCRQCGVNRYGSSGTFSDPGSDNGTIGVPGSSNPASDNGTIGVPGSEFIVGGYYASQGRFPWQVRLRIYKNGGYSTCGGAILASRWIITAAHCIYGSTSSLSYVYVGDHRISVTESTQVRHTFLARYPHPSYRSVSGRVTNNDIALVYTRTTIAFNDYVRPICLPSKAASYIGKRVVISGWGKTSATSGVSNTLKYAFANIVSSSQCSSGYTNLLCAKGQSSSSSCYGDSGGPMTIKENGHATLIGTAWFGIRNCPTTRSFGYTDIGPYLTWIKNKMNL